jgi:O-antigen/teichoic acid export membrane protein
MVTGPIVNAIYPRMVKLVTQGDMDGLATLYHQSAQLVTVLTAPVALLLSFFPNGVIFLWSGDSVLSTNAAPILSVLALGTFLNGLMHVPYQLQLAHGWTSLAIKTNVVAVMFIIPAIFWAVPLYGAAGAAWVWVILNTGYVLISMQFMHRRLITKEKLSWYLRDIFAPTVGATGVVLLAQQLQPDSYQNRWHWFVFLLITGCLALVASTVMAKGTRLHLLIIVRGLFEGRRV